MKFYRRKFQALRSDGRNCTIVETHVNDEKFISIFDSDTGELLRDDRPEWARGFSIVFDNEDIIEFEKEVGRYNGHTMSGNERIVDTLHCCCIDCGKEVVVGLNEYGRQSYLAYSDVRERCGG